MSNEYVLAKTGAGPDSSRYSIMPAGVTANSDQNSLSTEYGSDTSDTIESVTDNGYLISSVGIDVKGVKYKYIQYGTDNLLPFKIRHAIMSNMVTAQGQSFNILCCYGQGIKFIDRKTKEDVDDKEIRHFCLSNSIKEMFMEQATDMKFFSFAVTVIILSRDGKKIVKVRNKDAMFCRFEDATSTKSGKIEHVFFADWRTVGANRVVEVIPLLDYWDPLGDLNVRMGIDPDPRTGKKMKPGKERKFAILSRMATPGCQYYPTPYYMSIFRDSWMDIYRLIGIGKRYMIKNTSAPRVQIEVLNEYWGAVCDNEGITDPQKRKERIEKEKGDIVDFVTGLKNAGKALVSGYYVDPNGKENRMVRIINLNDPAKKEGGNWTDDLSEASNALCFALGVHPNLVGATPGKSQMNNSGSDKRELFTLKQALEKACHDVMEKPYHVILHYNKWDEKCTVDVPMLMLTTLDENTDAKKVTNNNNNNNNNQDGYNDNQQA